MVLNYFFESWRFLQSCRSLNLIAGIIRSSVPTTSLQILPLDRQGFDYKISGLQDTLLDIFYNSLAGNSSARCIVVMLPVFESRSCSALCFDGVQGARAKTLLGRIESWDS